MLKIKDIKINNSVWKKHKNVVNILYIITYILFFPVAIMQFIYIILEKIVDELSWFRQKIVYTIFKIIYKKELIADMVEKVVE